MSFKSVVYVEDEPDIRRIVNLLLSRRGIDVHDFACGREALESPPQAPDLILMDLMMHEMDGIETLSCLRKLDSYNTVPCIFFTAKADSNTLASLRKIPNTDVIYKPFEMRGFCDDLKTYYRRLTQSD